MWQLDEPRELTQTANICFGPDAAAVLSLQRSRAELLRTEDLGDDTGTAVDEGMFASIGYDVCEIHQILRSSIAELIYHVLSVA